ncbi:MAG: CbiX/SirB N-terminal domain-containing protein [Ectothiorhodospiraceae bacterium]|nr:CbiX/SirB N-terminal domain-containing protein [Ectothiorhodospiraceae bacterium]
MRFLLLIAHGSRRQASNEEVRQLAQRLADQAGNRYGGVRCAFLELAEPDIGQGVEQCIADGASEVLVLPYFLSAGRHVAEDIPRELAPKRARHPGIPIRLLDYAGASEQMPDLLLDLAERQIGGAESG